MTIVRIDAVGAGINTKQCGVGSHRRQKGRQASSNAKPTDIHTALSKERPLNTPVHFREMLSHLRYR